MKRLVLILLVFHSLTGLKNLEGQSIGVFGGGSRNNFYSFSKYQGDNYVGKYSPGFGYSFGISFENINCDTILFPIRFTLNLNNYKGQIYVYNGGLGGGSATTGEVNKYTLGLGIYPVNFRLILKKIQINIGGEFSFLIREKTIGEKSFWRMGAPNKTTTFENSGIQINRTYYFGLITRFSYDIRLKNNWFIVPQYFLYYGITNEFKNIEGKIKSKKQCLEFGLKKRF